jgi:hypothetical protein
LRFLKGQPLMLSQIFYLKAPGVTLVLKLLSRTIPCEIIGSCILTPLHPGTKMRLSGIWLIILYEIFYWTVSIIFLKTVPIYIIPDCVWHCRRIFKHPVQAVVACLLESLQNSMELEEQTTRTPFIWKRPIFKLIFLKHILINAQTLLVKESDQHHLQYWPQVQPFL